MAQANGTAPSTARRSTLLVTNLIKLSGLVLGLHEGFTTKDAVVIGMAAFMMAGAQASENLILAILDRVLGTPPPQEPGS